MLTKSESTDKDTFTNGAYAIFASRLAISVFPQPVGPIMRMFFGTISSLNASGMRCRRHLFPINKKNPQFTSLLKSTR